MKRITSTLVLIGVSSLAVVATAVPIGTDWTKEEPGHPFPSGPMRVPQNAFGYLWDMDLDAKLWRSQDGENWEKSPVQIPNLTYSVFNHQLLSNGNELIYVPESDDLSMYVTTDGQSWTEHPSPWKAHIYSNYIYFNDKYYRIGGTSPDIPFGQNREVWSSTDGYTWNEITPLANWAERVNPGLTAFSNRIFMLSGSDKQEVWSTADGSSWNAVAAQAPWLGRVRLGCASFNNNIWLIGGYNQNTSSVVPDV